MRYLITFIALLTASCAGTAAPPGWYVSGSHPMFQDEFYFVGVGRGDTYEAALEQAQGMLIRQIEVTIEADLTSIVSSYQTGDSEEITSQFRNATHSVASASLKGMEIGEKALDGGMHYVLAAIDKSAYIETLGAELDAKRQELADVYARSTSLLGEGRVWQAVNLLASTESAAAEFAARKTLFEALSRESYPSEGLLLGAALDARIRELLGAVKLIALSGEGQTAQAGSQLPEALTVQATYNGTPLRGATVVAKDDESRELGRIDTDEDGRAGFSVIAAGSGAGRVTVAFDFGGIPRRFQRELKGLTAEFSYTLKEPGPFVFEVVIKDAKGGRITRLEESVGRSVVNLGHKTAKGAPLILEGTMAQSDLKEIDGMGGKQYIAKVELNLSMKAADSGGKIAALTLTANGMSKSSKDDALTQAYGNFKISKNDMSRMLGMGAEKLTKFTGSADE